MIASLHQRNVCNVHAELTCRVNLLIYLDNLDKFLKGKRHSNIFYRFFLS